LITIIILQDLQINNYVFASKIRLCYKVLPQKMMTVKVMKLLVKKKVNMSRNAPATLKQTFKIGIGTKISTNFILNLKS
jgi:hypothetical protein